MNGAALSLLKKVYDKTHNDITVWQTTQAWDKDLKGFEINNLYNLYGSGYRLLDFSPGADFLAEGTSLSPLYYTQISGIEFTALRYSVLEKILLVGDNTYDSNLEVYENDNLTDIIPVSVGDYSPEGGEWNTINLLVQPGATYRLLFRGRPGYAHNKQPLEVANPYYNNVSWRRGTEGEIVDIVKAYGVIGVHFVSREALALSGSAEIDIDYPEFINKWMEAKVSFTNIDGQTINIDLTDSQDNILVGGLQNGITDLSHLDTSLEMKLKISIARTDVSKASPCVNSISISAEERADFIASTNKEKTIVRKFFNGDSKTIAPGDAVIIENGKAIKADNPVSNRTYWGMEREVKIEHTRLSSISDNLYHHHDNKYLMFSTNYFGFLQCQAITLNEDGTYQLHNVFMSTQLYGAPTRPHHLQVLDNNRVIVATTDTDQDKGYIGVLNIDESQNITEGVPQVFWNSANTSPGLALVGVDKVLLVFTRFDTTPAEHTVYSKILSITGTSIDMPPGNTILDNTLVGKTLSGISKISSDTVLITVYSAINGNLNYYIRRVVGSSNQNLGDGSFSTSVETGWDEITAHCMISPNEGVTAWMDGATNALVLQKFTIEDDWSMVLGTSLIFTQFHVFDPGNKLALFSLDDGSFLIRAHFTEFAGAVLARISEDLQVINVLEECNFEQNEVKDIWLVHREGNRLIMYQNFRDYSAYIYVLKPYGRRDFDGIAVTGSESGRPLDVQFDGILSNIYDNLQAGQLIFLDCDGRASQDGPLGAIVGKAVSAREIDLTQRNQPLSEYRMKRYLDRITNRVSTAEILLDIKGSGKIFRLESVSLGLCSIMIDGTELFDYMASVGNIFTDKILFEDGIEYYNRLTIKARSGGTTGYDVTFVIDYGVIE